MLKNLLKKITSVFRGYPSGQNFQGRQHSQKKDRTAESAPRGPKLPTGSTGGVSAKVPGQRKVPHGQPAPGNVHCTRKKKLCTLLDLCVSSLRRGHANLLCIVPILTDDPRRESICWGPGREEDVGLKRIRPGI